MTARASRNALLAWLAVATRGRSQDDIVTYSGYVIDFYCLGLVESGGSSLDSSDVIKEPWKHTLHCLRDIPQCRDGYYLAGKGGDGKYMPKFAFDDASHNAALALMDSFPMGSSRDYKSFAVTAIGRHSGDGYLRGATFSTCFQSTGCDSVCRAGNATTCVTPEIKYTIPVGGLLIAHVVCMCLSWGCLLPLGVLWARNMRQSKWTPAGVPAWFAGHRMLQSAGVALQLLGFIFIFIHKKAGHFKLPHEVLGLSVVVLGLLQPLNAQLRHLKCIGHPLPDGTRTAARAAWELMHKACGWVCLAGGAANVVLGPVFASTLRFRTGLVVGSAIFLGLSLGSLVLGGLALEARRLFSRASKTPPDVREF